MSKYHLNPNGTLPLNPGGSNGPVLMNQGQVRSRCDCCYCPCYDFFNGELFGDFRKNITGFPCCGLVEEYLLTQTVPYQATAQAGLQTRIASPVVLRKTENINIGGRNDFACGWRAENVVVERSTDGGATWERSSILYEILLNGPTTDPIGGYQWVGIEGRCIWELQYGFQLPFTLERGPHYKFYYQDDLPTGTYNVAPYFYAGQFEVS